MPSTERESKLLDHAWYEVSMTKAKRNDTTVLVREQLLLLGVMNTFQPVSFDVLKSALSNVFNSAKLQKTLRILAKKKAVVRLSEGTYYVTEKGRVAIGTGSLSRERDRARMLYLVEKRKEGI